MERLCTFEGLKEISTITNASEVNLPEYADMRRIYLRSKQEVNRALTKGIKVYQQHIDGEFGTRTMVYIEVPFDKLLDCAE